MSLKSNLTAHSLHLFDNTWTKETSAWATFPRQKLHALRAHSNCISHSDAELLPGSIAREKSSPTVPVIK